MLRYCGSESGSASWKRGEDGGRRTRGQNRAEKEEVSKQIGAFLMKLGRALVSWEKGQLELFLLVVVSTLRPEVLFNWLICGVWKRRLIFLFRFASSECCPLSQAGFLFLAMTAGGRLHPFDWVICCLPCCSQMSLAATLSLWYNSPLLICCTGIWPGRFPAVLGGVKLLGTMMSLEFRLSVNPTPACLRLCTGSCLWISQFLTAST